MFCMHCGQKIDDASKFCEFCGTPVDGAETPAAGAQAGSTQPIQGATRVVPAVGAQDAGEYGQGAGQQAYNQQAYNQQAAYNQQVPMATCPTCGSPIPSNSASCPYCGTPFSSAPKKGVAGTVVAVLAGVAAVAALAAFLLVGPPDLASQLTGGSQDSGQTMVADDGDDEDDGTANTDDDADDSDDGLAFEAYEDDDADDLDYDDDTDNDDGYDDDLYDYNPGDPVIDEMAWSSQLPDDGDFTYDGYNMLDGSLETCWAEGTSGNGEGEYIILYLDGYQDVSGFQIIPGYVKTEDLYYQNARPLEVDIYIDGVYYETHTFEDKYNTRWTGTFSEPVTCSVIEFDITEVADGSLYDDCCITELSLF